jgi:hypothetical protein
MQGVEHFTIISDDSNSEDHTVKAEYCEISPHHRWMLEVIGFGDFSLRVYGNVTRRVSGRESVLEFRLGSSK